MTNPLPDLSGYEAAVQTAAYFRQDEAGAILISGPDRVNFLQRQTTNDLRLLQPERALLTVLTSPTARVLNVFYLIEESEAIQALTPPGLGPAGFRFLKSRIFFNDNVSVSDVSQALAQIDLIGPQAVDMLTDLGLKHLPAENQVAPFDMADNAGHILAMTGAYGLGYRLIAPAEAGEAIEAALHAAGATQLSAQGFQILRVEAGLPEAGHEWTEAYTPLEAGLEVAVADNKGCYTGQEVIARQITYDKVTQRLRGLRLENEATPGEKVWVDGKAVGVVTSAALSPRLGPLGLAVVKRPHHEPGTSVLVGNTTERVSPAMVAALPFQA